MRCTNLLPQVKKAFPKGHDSRGGRGPPNDFRGGYGGRGGGDRGGGGWGGPPDPRMMQQMYQMMQMYQVTPLACDTPRV